MYDLYRIAFVIWVSTEISFFVDGKYFDAWVDVVKRELRVKRSGIPKQQEANKLVGTGKISFLKNIRGYPRLGSGGFSFFLFPSQYSTWIFD